MCALLPFQSRDLDSSSSLHLWKCVWIRWVILAQNFEAVCVWFDHCTNDNYWAIHLKRSEAWSVCNNGPYGFYINLRTRARYDHPSTTLLLEVATMMDITVAQEREESKQHHATSQNDDPVKKKEDEDKYLLIDFDPYAHAYVWKLTFGKRRAIAVPWPVPVIRIIVCLMSNCHVRHGLQRAGYRRQQRVH